MFKELIGEAQGSGKVGLHRVKNCEGVSAIGGNMEARRSLPGGTAKNFLGK